MKGKGYSQEQLSRMYKKHGSPKREGPLITIGKMTKEQLKRYIIAMGGTPPSTTQAGLASHAKDLYRKRKRSPYPYANSASPKKRGKTTPRSPKKGGKKSPKKGGKKAASCSSKYKACLARKSKE